MNFGADSHNRLVRKNLSEPVPGDLSRARIIEAANGARPYLEGGSYVFCSEMILISAEHPGLHGVLETRLVGVPRSRVALHTKYL